jgi:hypothetical protein
MPRSREERDAEIARLDGILDSGVRDQLAALPGVVQVTHGLKLVGGAATDDLAIAVFVDEKLPIADLAPEHVVPPTVEGVPTDVLPVPTMDLYTLTGGTQITNGYTARKGPGNYPMEAGTLGFVAKTNDKDQNPVILSCAHVIGHLGAVVDHDLVFQPQPGPDDVIHDSDTFPRRPNTSSNSVGTIRKIVKTSHEVDGAIAQISTCRSWCFDCGTSYTHAIEGLHAIPVPQGVPTHAPRSDAITGVATAQDDMYVFKVGITTHGTAGRITHASAPVTVKDYFGEAEFHFENQILIAGLPGTRFADHGDSGAMLVNSDGKIVGMVAGGFPPTGPDPSTAIAHANNIGRVMIELGISFPIRAKQPATAVASVRAGRVSFADEGPDMLNTLRDRVGRSAVGQALLDAINEHLDEIVALVNDRRRVTVAWHRGQGPAWLAAFARSARHPDYRLPTEIEGVTRAEALAALHTALLAEGSDEFRASLRELPAFLVPALGECQSVDELLGRLDETTEQRS